MKRVQKFIVIAYRLVRHRPQQAEMRQASTEAGACRLAELLAERYAGAAAYEVFVEEETGEMQDPRELAAYGGTLSIEQMVA